MAMSTHKSRQKGGLFGLLIGDALGVPYEFHRREAIPDPQLIEMTPPDGFRRAHRGVPPGTWSDDGAQALCLLASLLDKGRLELDDFAARLLDWYEKGYLAVDGRVFDVGVQTTVAFRALMGGAAPHLAGPAEERSNGNGSLMRVLPLALWHQGTDEDLVRDAYLQSRVTHGHARSRVCCALYCLWARRTLSSHAAPWDDAVRTLRSLVTPESEEHEALEVHIAPDAAPEGDRLRRRHAPVGAHGREPEVVRGRGSRRRHTRGRHRHHRVRRGGHRGAPGGLRRHPRALAQRASRAGARDPPRGQAPRAKPRPLSRPETGCRPLPRGTARG